MNEPMIPDSTTNHTPSPDRATNEPTARSSEDAVIRNSFESLFTTPRTGESVLSVDEIQQAYRLFQAMEEGDDAPSVSQTQLVTNLTIGAAFEETASLAAWDRPTDWPELLRRIKVRVHGFEPIRDRDRWNFLVQCGQVILKRPELHDRLTNLLRPRLAQSAADTRLQSLASTAAHDPDLLPAIVADFRAVQPLAAEVFVVHHYLQVPLDDIAALLGISAIDANQVASDSYDTILAEVRLATVGHG